MKDVDVLHAAIEKLRELVKEPPIIKTKTIWHVCAYTTRPNSDGEMERVYSMHFSNREEAHEIFARGEKEVGIEYGIHWHMKSCPIDAEYAEDELDELIKETKEEETNE